MSVEIEFSEQSIKTHSNIKLHKNPSSGIPSCSMRTNRHTRRS